MINKFSYIFLAKTICIIVIFFFNSFNLFSQTENQFTNEFQFNRNIVKLTAMEFDFAQGFTSGEEENNPFYKNSQISARLWLHYFANKKWKLSGFAAFFYNRDVPEISQKKSPEVRFAFQGIYYINRTDYVLTNRLRIEDRILGNAEGTVDIVYRFREMVKLVYPISYVQIGKGSLYGIVSEELVFKTKGSTTGEGFFDRNRLTLGLGYSFTDTIQFELTYMNEYLPRNASDKMYNVLSTTLIFNDLIYALKRKSGSIQAY